MRNPCRRGADASSPILKGTPAELKAAFGTTAIQAIDAEPGTKKEF